MALTVPRRDRGLGALLALVSATACSRHPAPRPRCSASLAHRRPAAAAGLVRVSDPWLAGIGIVAVALPALAWLANLALPRSTREAVLALRSPASCCSPRPARPRSPMRIAGTAPVKGQGFPVFGHRRRLQRLHPRCRLASRDPPPARRARALARPRAAAHGRPRRARAAQPPHPDDREPERPGLVPALRPRRAAAAAAVRALAAGPAQHRAEPGVRQPLIERRARAPLRRAGGGGAVGGDLLAPARAAARLPAAAPRRAGWRNVALHPSPPRTFNLSKAYPALGFTDPAFASDLDMTDRDGQFLSAPSTSSSTGAASAAARGGHARSCPTPSSTPRIFPTSATSSAAPIEVRPDGASPLVTGYLNAIYDMADAIDRFPLRLQARIRTA